MQILFNEFDYLIFCVSSFQVHCSIPNYNDSVTVDSYNQLVIPALHNHYVFVFLFDHYSDPYMVEQLPIP